MEEKLKVALIHDDLVQWGGAERVLAVLAEIFPDAPIYTSVYDWDNPLITSHFPRERVRTSFIQKIPGWRSFYKALFFLHPLSFESFDFTGYDLVFSQTTRFAKSIITKPKTVHVCYCHTPPRFLWHFSGEKPPAILSLLLNTFRIYDQASSQRVDFWLAGSKNAQKRLKKIYRVESELLYPFVDTDSFQDTEPFDGGYLLVVSRLNGYKRVDLAVKAATKLRLPLKIVGVGPKENDLRKMAGPTVDFVGRVSEITLRDLLSGCRALLVTAEEDFGLTPLEAMACGKPVIAFGQGGVLETVVEGKTGYFFAEQNEDAVLDALAKLDRKGYNQKECLRVAQQFSKTQYIRQFRKLLAPRLDMKS